jgi:8-oxo-dGTP diphosphatase
MLKLDEKHIIITGDIGELSNYTPKTNVAICFVEANNKLLMLKNNNDNKFQNHVWGVPGGKLEANEKPSEAAQREIFEETNLSIPVTNLNFIMQLFVRVKPNFDYELHVYRTILNQNPSSLNIVIDLNEHAEFKWVTPAEALKLDLIYGERELIQHIYYSI